MTPALLQFSSYLPHLITEESNISRNKLYYDQLYKLSMFRGPSAGVGGGAGDKPSRAPAGLQKQVLNNIKQLI